MFQPQQGPQPPACSGGHVSGFSHFTFPNSLLLNLLARGFR